MSTASGSPQANPRREKTAREHGPQDGSPQGEGDALRHATSWGHATWTDLEHAGLGRGRSGTRVVALLPVGAVEAHGPHLPLVTDVVIAEAAARAALPGLQGRGLDPFLLPPVPYTAAPIAAGFPGTISLRPDTFSALLTDVATSLERQAVAALVVVNAHLDPAHLASILQAVHAYPGSMPVIHPDLTERRWALRLGEEFRSGACHAGCYETSVVMAAAPELVREGVRRTLPGNPASLSLAIRAGKTTFEEAGVAQAYCGDPAAASAAEGEETIAVLGRIVVKAVAQRLGSGDGASGSAEEDETVRVAADRLPGG